jgi:hypothetical protein
LQSREGKLSHQPKPGQQAFALEIGGRAVLVLASADIERAKALCSEHWFFEELASYRSCGRPIWDGVGQLRIRRADACETAELNAAHRIEKCRGEYEGYVFAFLVPIDPTLQ